MTSGSSPGKRARPLSSTWPPGISIRSSALALKEDKGDKPLFPEIDDPGSDSRFSFRLPEKGQYKILVHAFKFKGGGNYELIVRRFLAKPLEVGKPLVGTFDRHGKAYHYFQGVKDQILTTEVKGTSLDGWKMLDTKAAR